MLIKKILTSPLNRLLNINSIKTQKINIKNHSIKPWISNGLSKCFYSKQKIREELEKLNSQLDLKYNQLQTTNQNAAKNQFQQKQQAILKDFLQLTEHSFNQHLQQSLSQKYLIDSQILLMILSGLQDPNIIKENIPKLYAFVGVLKKPQLLLLFQLILSYKPQTLPPLSTVTPRPLQEIETILLILSEIYNKDGRLIEWLKEVPLYKGKNLCMMAAGFFSVVQKMQQHLKFKHDKLLQRCIERIIHLALDQDQQTKITILILALQSPSTSHYAQKLLIEIQSLDYSQIDPLKTQLFFIHLQKHITQNYSEIKKQLKTKTKYKILQQSNQGQLTQTIEEEYTFNKQSIQHQQTSQIEKYKFIHSISKNTLQTIIDMNWKETFKLNLLLQYWKLLPTFQKAYPFNSFQAKLISFTLEKEIMHKLTNLTQNELLTILEVIETLKINKPQLLIKLLALISQHLGTLDTHQLIRLSKVCVTYVRQCQDFLITLRKFIQSQLFIFDNQQVDQLNSIFKRVITLFPRPLVK